MRDRRAVVIDGRALLASVASRPHRGEHVFALAANTRPVHALAHGLRRLRIACQCKKGVLTAKA